MGSHNKYREEKYGCVSVFQGTQRENWAYILLFEATESQSPLKALEK